MIGVINYHGGNAPSVAAALTQLGLPHQLVDAAEGLEQASHVILPGVGAARATLQSLRALDLIAPLETHAIENKKPFLGICVGLQVLFEQSEEDDCPCLGWLPGSVHRFDDTKVRVPQIGWNELTFETQSHPLADVVPAHSYCYFVNSYHAKPSHPDVLVASTDYGGKSTALVAKDKIWASQFHMEKSGPVGLRMLRAFADLPVGAADFDDVEARKAS